MVIITKRAQDQLEALEQHYERLERDDATRRLSEALLIAMARIEAGKGPFLAAPRPYPNLAGEGWLWLKQGRYWIAFTDVGSNHAVTGIFFDTANIPERARPGHG